MAVENTDRLIHRYVSVSGPLTDLNRQSFPATHNRVCGAFIPQRRPLGLLDSPSLNRMRASSSASGGSSERARTIVRSALLICSASVLRIDALRELIEMMVQACPSCADQIKRMPVGEFIHNAGTDFAPVYDPRLVKDRKMLRNVLLNATHRITEFVHSRSPVAQLVDQPDSERLPKDPDAPCYRFRERIADWLALLRPPFRLASHARSLCCPRSCSTSAVVGPQAEALVH